MQIVLYVLGGLLLLVAIAAVYLYFRMKKYLARSEENIQGTVSAITEEIDSYQEKTQ
ncbi:MAG: hypothetical protein ACE5HL_11175 [Terriglobia bacterium]